MPDLRPIVDHEQMLALVSQHFPSPITDLTPLEGGQVARTFSFRVGEEEYVVRFNTDKLGANFPKEVYLSHLLASSHIPIPRILHVGRLGDLEFAISQKAPGKMLEQHSPQEVKQLLPELIKLLDTIHQIDVSKTQGYGVIDNQGVGRSASWRDHLCQVNQEENGGFYGQWHHMFDDTFLERDLFERIYQQMQGLLGACPTERSLVHGNYSFRDILAQDGKVTAILDWIGAKYGDFVYDIAWLDFWSPGFAVRERSQEYYQEQQREIPSYAERVLCYQCNIALDAMRFFAKGENEQAYQWVREQILQKLA